MAFFVRKEVEESRVVVVVDDFQRSSVVELLLPRSEGLRARKEERAGRTQGIVRDGVFGIQKCRDDEGGFK